MNWAPVTLYHNLNFKININSKRFQVCWNSRRFMISADFKCSCVQSVAQNIPKYSCAVKSVRGKKLCLRSNPRNYYSAKNKRKICEIFLINRDFHKAQKEREKQFLIRFWTLLLWQRTQCNVSVQIEKKMNANARRKGLTIVIRNDFEILHQNMRKLMALHAITGGVHEFCC